MPFPDKAQQIEAVLRLHQREGKYDGITQGKLLAKQLMDDINGVVRDKHMLIDVSERPVPPDSNLGVENVDHLRHNIGYLQI